MSQEHIIDLTYKYYCIKNSDKNTLIDYVDFFPIDFYYKYKTLIDKFKKNNLEILFFGSSVIKYFFDNNFEPNDIDICIKNISVEKIILIDNCITELFKNHKIIKARNTLCISWNIFDNTNHIRTIQLNIAQISHWSEFFITCNSDFSRIGYDVVNQSFCFLNNSFSFKKKDIYYISNIFSCDTCGSINNYIAKYSKRGFNCKALYIGDNESLGSINKKVGGAKSRMTKIIIPDNLKKNPIVLFFISKYYNYINICFDNDILNILTSNENFIDIMSIYKINQGLFKEIQIPLFLRQNNNNNNNNNSDNIIAFLNRFE